VHDYRRETLRTIKRTFLPPAHDLYKVNYRGLKADALGVFEPQLLAAAQVEAHNPNNVPPGQLREIVVRDPHNGSEVRKFVGQDHFVKLPNFGCATRAYGGHREGRRAHIWDPRTNSWFPYPPQSRRAA